MSGERVKFVRDSASGDMIGELSDNPPPSGEGERERLRIDHVAALQMCVDGYDWEADTSADEERLAVRLAREAVATLTRLSQRPGSGDVFLSSSPPSPSGSETE